MGMAMRERRARDGRNPAGAEIGMEIATELVPTEMEREAHTCAHSGRLYMPVTNTEKRVRTRKKPAERDNRC